MLSEEYKSLFDLLTIPDAGASFKGCDARTLCGPVVYMFSLERRPLYIGMSKNGIGRVFSPHKQADKAREECDELLIFPTPTVEAAMELEELMVSLFEPMYNKRLSNKWTREQAADHLGVSYRQLARSRWSMSPAV
jgi:hypothetical protein